jgi:hypothetical protein
MTEEAKKPEEGNGEDKHPIFALWAQDDDTGNPMFVIRCDCGETLYKLEKDFFGDPPKIYAGMTMVEYQKTQKAHMKLDGMKKQVQRVALTQHADSYGECPAIQRLKDEAGVDSIQQLPDPFKG